MSTNPTPSVPVYTRWMRFLIALDQALGTIIFRDCWPDETMSAYVWRRDRKHWIKAINWLFSDLNHCESAYKAEKNGAQNAPEYRAKFDEESA